MSILVTGSLAYDYIMQFNGIFAKHILPDKLNVLNVSFTADSMNKNFGGTAGNIAYGLTLLKEKPTIFTTVGRDFDEYKHYLNTKGIDTSEVKVLSNELTASAHIITDKDANQITAFHGGAMLKNNVSITPLLKQHPVKFAIIAADGKAGMIQHVRELKEQKIPYVYDPGHSLPAFEKAEFQEFLDGAHVLVVNRYEIELLQQKCAIPLDKLVAQIPYVIITQGKEGSVIYHQKRKIEIPSVKTDKAVDPTGAGDAYRGGILKGLLHNLPPEVFGRLASLAACYCVENQGTQNYSYTPEEFKDRYIKNYGKEAALNKLF